MKILVIDPFKTGHHLTYLYHFTEAFLNTGVDVVCIGAINNEFSQKFNSLSDQYPHKLIYSQLVDEYGGYFNKSSIKFLDIVKSRWLKINELVIFYGNNFDLVFLPWLDSYIDGRIECDFYDQLLFNWSGIYFQPYFLNKNIKNMSKNKFLNPSVLFSHKSCRSLGFLVDSTLVKEHTVFKNKPLYIIPDFADMDLVEIKDFKKEISYKKKGRYAIGLYGSIAKRKGILPLMKAIDKYKMSNDFFFIIAGEFIEHNFSSEEKELIFSVIHKNNDAFFFHPQRLDSESEFNYLLSLCDVVFAAYDNFFYSSNMLIKAASLDKPIIVVKETYMGDIVDRYQLGLTIELTPKMIFKSINKIKSSHDTIINSDKIREFIKLQSLDELKIVIKQLVLQS